MCFFMTNDTPEPSFQYILNLIGTKEKCQHHLVLPGIGIGTAAPLMLNLYPLLLTMSLLKKQG